MGKGSLLLDGVSQRAGLGLRQLFLICWGKGLLLSGQPYACCVDRRDGDVRGPFSDRCFRQPHPIGLEGNRSLSLQCSNLDLRARRRRVVADQLAADGPRPGNAVVGQRDSIREMRKIKRRRGTTRCVQGGSRRDNSHTIPHRRRPRSRTLGDPCRRDAVFDVQPQLRRILTGQPTVRR